MNDRNEEEFDRYVCWLFMQYSVVVQCHSVGCVVVLCWGVFPLLFLSFSSSFHSMQLLEETCTWFDILTCFVADFVRQRVSKIQIFFLRASPAKKDWRAKCAIVLLHSERFMAIFNTTKNKIFRSMRKRVIIQQIQIFQIKPNLITYKIRHHGKWPTNFLFWMLPDLQSNF